MSAQFNASRLILARQYREFSQKQLSTMVGVTQASLSKFENGDKVPSEQTQAVLAHALKFPSSFFVAPVEHSAHALSFHAYRKKASISTTKIDRVHAEMTIKSMHQAYIKQKLNTEECDLFSAQKDLSPAALASYLRNLWGIGTSPIENLTQLIEDMGIDIYLCDFIDISVDGVTSKSATSKHKAIFINKNQPADRYRFSLAHELYHYAAHTNESVASKEMEDEANSFAGELLMPQTALKKVLNTTSLKDFANLKQEWRVSMAALIYRAKQIGCISAAQSTALWKQMAMHGFRTVEPYPLKAEYPKRVNNLLIKLLEISNLEIKDLPNIFNLTQDDFEKLYPNFYDVQENPVT